MSERVESFETLQFVLDGLQGLLGVIAENLDKHGTDPRVPLAQAGNIRGCRRDILRLMDRLPKEGEFDAGRTDS